MKLLNFQAALSCKVIDFKSAKKGYKNMYSEQISNKNIANEFKLIKLLKNVQCKRCGLIYKKNWFDKKTSNEIFNRLNCPLIQRAGM